MTEAAKILCLIETVAPDDKKMLCEINNLVGMYVNKISPRDWYGANLGTYVSYVTSRDALKAIRPTGWMFFEHNQDYATGVWQTILINPAHGGENAIFSGEQLREELSELHAIIQAIEYDRAQNQKP